MPMRRRISAGAHRGDRGSDVTNACRLGGQPLGRDLTPRKKLVEQTFAVDQVGPEWSSRSAHPVTDRRHLTSLGIGQAKLPRECKNMAGTGIAVECAGASARCSA